ncbi:MAG: DUF4428 domain-containing protein [Lachnospiraceae bacterium]|nr:DUF4428 domain-containing protein [Lachnospiraceae bacterium]
MGLFGKLFSKQVCAFCGKEVGAMHHSKMKDGEYACNECAAKCSEFVRLSEMDKNTVAEHMSFMEKRSGVYNSMFSGKSQNTFFNNRRNYGLAFCDELGLVAILNFKKNRINTEVLRYDEIASYEPYYEKTTQDGKEIFKESGIILRVLPAGRMMNDPEKQRGLRQHPYITRDMKLCFRTDEKETDYADNAAAHLDFIFGVNDSKRGLFQFGSTKEEKRQIEAGAKMAGMLGSAIKGAVTGNVDEEKLKEQFAAASDAADAANTGGLLKYSKAADAALAEV